MNYLYFGIVLGIFTLVWIFLKWKKRMIMVTHSGAYHLDDVFSTSVLIIKAKMEGNFFQVIRTRDEKKFEKWRMARKKGREVYIYDVGRIYNEEKNEFDHHQIGGAGKRKNGIEYSSAGLVWKKFGKEVCGSEEIAWKIEKKMVLAIDALDNGQSIYEQKYDFYNYDLSNLIKSFLPVKKNKFKLNFAFCKSVRLLENILKKEINFSKKLVDDEKKVSEVYRKSENKKVLIFKDSDISTISIVEKYPDVLFTITQKEKNVWVIETISKKFGSFERRKYLPKSWGGLEGYDLDNITGVVGGIFCHRNVFIASARTEKSAREMVEIALKNKE